MRCLKKGIKRREKKSETGRRQEKERKSENEPNVCKYFLAIIKLGQHTRRWGGGGR